MIFRGSDIEQLGATAVELKSRGFWVGPVVVPENPWVDGNPYFNTDAPCRDISDAYRGAREALVRARNAG